MDENIADDPWWRRQATAQAEWWRKRAAAHEGETLRQNSLMYGGLIGIGAVLVQPFLTSGAASLDLSAKICVIATSSWRVSATATGCCAAFRMSMKTALTMRTTDSVLVYMVPA